MGRQVTIQLLIDYTSCPESSRERALLAAPVPTKDQEMFGTAASQSSSLHELPASAEPPEGIHLIQRV